MGVCQSTLGAALPRESVAMGAAPSVLMKFEDIDRMYAFGQQLYQGTRSAVHRVSHRATGMVRLRWQNSGLAWCAGAFLTCAGSAAGAAHGTCE